jgi:tRNA G18 (ribose-2'-O)-methylase SpoU
VDRVVTLIDSKDDPRVQPYFDIRHSKLDHPRSHFIAEGRWVVQRLVASGHDIHSVLVQMGRESMLPADFPTRVPVYVADKSLIAQLVGFEFHRGILACGVRRPLASLDQLVTDAVTSTVIPALMNVTCPENLGSILRSAAAFGIDQILIGPGTLDHLARRVIRVSMGAVFTQRFYQLLDPENELVSLKDESRFRVVATTLGQGAADIDDFAPSGDRVIVMMGNEATGLSGIVESLATDRVKIATHEGVDSLNVAVASAIFFHELTRRRRE